MKTLIRDLDTGTFYRAPGQWVQSEWEATVFGTHETAEIEAHRIEKTNLEIYITWDNGKPAWGYRIAPHQ